MIVSQFLSIKMLFSLDQSFTTMSTVYRDPSHHILLEEKQHNKDMNKLEKVLFIQVSLDDPVDDVLDIINKF